MKKTKLFVLASAACMLVSCGGNTSSVPSSTPAPSSVAPISSSESPTSSSTAPVSSSTVPVSSSTAPVVKVAPTQAELAAACEELLSATKSSYTYKYRKYQSNSMDFIVRDNHEEVINMKKYSNGNDGEIAFNYLKGAASPTIESSEKGRYVAYDLDDKSFAVSCAIDGGSKNENDFYIVRETNRYINSSNIISLEDELIELGFSVFSDPAAQWPSDLGYSAPVFAAEEQEDGSYKCVITVQAENDPESYYSAEDQITTIITDANHKIISLDYTQILYHADRTDDLDASANSITNSSISNIVLGELVEGTIAPVDYSKMSADKVSLPATVVEDVEEGVLSDDVTLNILSNIVAYTEGTISSTGSVYYSEIYDDEYNSLGAGTAAIQADVFDDDIFVLTENYTLEDETIQPFTSFMQRVGVDDGIEQMSGTEGLTETYFGSKYAGQDVSTMASYFNPSVYYLNFTFSAISRECSSAGFGKFVSDYATNNYANNGSKKEGDTITINFSSLMETSWGTKTGYNFVITIVDNFLQSVSIKDTQSPTSPASVYNMTKGTPVAYTGTLIPFVKTEFSW